MSIIVNVLWMRNSNGRVYYAFITLFVRIINVVNTLVFFG